MNNNLNNGAAGAKNLVAEFFDFLKQFGVIGLAIGVVVGGAVKEYVDAIVKTMVTPFVNYILGLIKFQAGGVVNLPALAGNKPEALLVGELISSTINFFVLMVIVFIAVKFFINKFMHDSDKANTGVK